ncbi:hypothetical protein, partial [Escherichia coli]|uniref:hypothetical protein n=1 Tax=Escherichia coli TaxID=562 RepID=UPI003CE894CC
GFRIAVQFFHAGRGVGHGHAAQKHPLVARGQVIKKFLGFLALQFHIVRDRAREILVGLLALVVARDVCFHLVQLQRRLFDSLVRG